MSYDDLMQLVCNAGPDDWLHDDSRGLHILKADLLVTVRENRVYDHEKRQYIQEKWATQFPDKHAWLENVELRYGNTPVRDYLFAVVDGARALLPCPRFGTREITREQFSIALAVNDCRYAGYFLEYIAQFAVVS